MTLQRHAQPAVQRVLSGELPAEAARLRGPRSGPSVTRAQSGGSAAWPACRLAGRRLAALPLGRQPPGCLAAWPPGLLAAWPAGRLAALICGNQRQKQTKTKTSEARQKSRDVRGAEPKIPRSPRPQEENAFAESKAPAQEGARTANTSATAARTAKGSVTTSALGGAVAA